jgi:outer membrane receptor for ferrienterochelin and colicin
MSIGIVFAAIVLAQADQIPPAPPVAVATSSGEIDAGIIPYPAAFFADARPTSAFDMIQRLPGFTFARGENVRGFAGAAGNVLIDGERPTSKSVSLEDLLRRLPATSVVRIDLVRGGAPGIDMQGQPLVANVIRSKDASQDFAVTLGARFYDDDNWTGAQADAEWARRSGALSLEGAAHYSGTEDADGGRGQRTRYFPDGVVQESGPFYTRGRTGTFSANGSAELDKVDNVFRLNGGYSRENSNDYERVDRRAPGGGGRGEQVTAQSRVSNKLELGGDYTRSFSPALSVQVLALQTLTHIDSKENSAQPAQVETSTSLEKSGESILRTSLSYEAASTLSFQAGGEGAFNFLDGRTTVIQSGVPVALPNANLRVEETRGELFLTTSWQPTSELNIEAGARAEASRISQSGDTARSRSFFYPKPSLIVAWSPDATSQVRVRLQRQVGQLRFRDFVASADLATGTLSAGNSDLEPERAWVYELALERRFWGKGALVATFTHEAVEQVVDLIPIAGSDSPGNIGDGTRDRASLALTVPLDRLGISNGLLTATATWRQSEVTDPVTGQKRRISRETPFGAQANFSQDISALSSTWGIEGRLANREVSYRINEIRTESEDDMWSVYWDYKPAQSLSVRAEFRNLSTRERRRVRDRFAGSRALGVLNEVELQDNEFQPFAYLRVRRAF